MILRMLNRILQKTWLLLNDRPLPPPSKKVEQGVEELRVAFQKLSRQQEVDSSSTENEWTENLLRLTERVFSDDPRQFLRWGVILKTMFVDHAPYINTELKHLKTLADWRDRWRTAVQESPIGHPILYWKYPRSSGNLIHHAYHLAQFERVTLQKIQNLEFIFEFGGGYGSLCRLCHNLGFRGLYVIFDLPHFSALQQYYLKSVGIPVCSGGAISSSTVGAKCIHDVERLPKALTLKSDQPASLFIATWSLSETPLPFRKTILNRMRLFGRYLIAYQDRFQGIDNRSFFDRWIRSQPNIEWNTWEIEHLRQNRYLIGTRKAFN